LATFFVVSVLDWPQAVKEKISSTASNSITINLGIELSLLIIL
jgi:hypothetical protein